jgi:hypothetical protein
MSGQDQINAAWAKTQAQPAAPEAVEASDLGFMPGLWPAKFEREGVRWYLGWVERDPEGELVAVHYTTATGGRRLVVFND